MDGKQGAVLFDGWTCASTNCIGVIASYCADKLNSSDSRNNRLVLLAMSPMGQVSDNSSESNALSETTTFNANCHLQFLKPIFQFYNQVYEDWCVCLIRVKCATNLKMAHLSKKSYVGCCSHKLNFELILMVEEQASLKYCLENIHKTMTTAKKLKNAALLRNLTDLRPIVDNETRWAGKRHMLQRFIQIRQQLIKVQETEDGDLYTNTSQRLLMEKEKFTKILQEIEIVVKLVQTRVRTLAECRDDLNMLIEAVEEEQNNTNSALYMCSFGTKYIDAESSIVKSKNFENGVVKIQKGQEQDLSVHEKAAVSCLKRQNGLTEFNIDDENNYDSCETSIEGRLKKRQKVVKKSEKYIDTSFILRSVAEVERMWSISKYVLTENRRSTTPEMFEAIIFLKINTRFWDSSLVAEAARKAKVDRADARVNAHFQQEHIFHS